MNSAITDPGSAPVADLTPLKASLPLATAGVTGEGTLLPRPTSQARSGGTSLPLPLGEGRGESGAVVLQAKAITKRFTSEMTAIGTMSACRGSLGMRLIK